jgi:hypothetical protein
MILPYTYNILKYKTNYKKYKGIFAISVDGVVEWDLYEKGGINTDRLIEFLEKNITSKLTYLASTDFHP